MPTSDPTGQVAGLVANVASGQACWIVVSREGSCLGSETETLWMLASPDAEETLTSRLVPFFFEPGARVETLNPGLKGRFLQPPAANGDETCAAVPCTETIVPVICSALQLVGLKTNCGRSIVTFTVCTRSGTPSRICGSGSLVTVSAAVLGSMFSAARTTT